MLRLYNTLTKKKEEFQPLSNKTVGMYNCGPTVYDRAHIGNLRSYVFADVLRRTLQWNGYEVNHVINITDIGHLTSDGDSGEDKMARGLTREGLPLTREAMYQLGTKYTKSFLEDIAALNIQKPTTLPRASDHVSQQIKLIEMLEKKGFIYTTSDGVYFDTSKDPHYGKLGGLSDQLQERTAQNPQKKHPRDFALWKFNDVLGIASPWGKGFPGWHIECSAMSMHYLGETFDIHTGGIEHIPTHHNNEIAQSENATGKPFAHFWLHNQWLQLKGEKMAKSTGGFITLETLKEKNISPLAYRYLLLGAHYRTPVEFSWEALSAAQTAYMKLRERVQKLGVTESAPDKRYIKTFTKAINDDLNTPQALAVMWELLKDSSIPNAEKKATLSVFDRVFGLNLHSHDSVVVTIPKHVQELADARRQARDQNDFDTADTLRKQIHEAGFDVEDTEGGPIIKPLERL